MIYKLSDVYYIITTAVRFMLIGNGFEIILLYFIRANEYDRLEICFYIFFLFFNFSIGKTPRRTTFHEDTNVCNIIYNNTYYIDRPG